MRRSLTPLALALPLLLVPSQAGATDRLCDTRKVDCRASLLTMINDEPTGGGIDVAFWFMTDDNYRSALQNALNRGVRVRILVDPRANETKAGNADILAALAAAGIPMRMKVAQSWSDILHWKMMFFERQQNNKSVVEFSAANYTPDSFVPNTPYQNYIDEVIYTTDDPRITDTFATKFEDYWTDTSGLFKDYANLAGPPYPRYYPIYTPDPALNFPPTQDYANKAIVNYNREISIGAPSGAKIDVIMYRISDGRHADSMIQAFNAGIPVRLITEQENYRDGRYIWHSYNVDRMWAAGISVKDHVNGKQGITHQKSVILYAQKEVIFGSSNWSSASSNQQLEHNLFSKPCTALQTTWCDGGGPNSNPPNWFFNWFVQQFNDKWNSVNPTGFVEFRPFVPLPGGTPVNSLPAKGATGVPTTGVTFRWDGGNWNHKYDVYLTRTPSFTADGKPIFAATDKIASDIMVGSPYTGTWETWTLPSNITLLPGTTYWWQVVGKTMADSPRSAAAGLKLAKPGEGWSFTTAGTAPPGGSSTPFGGTPAVLPGTLQTENFDEGGPNVAYVDTTSGNSGGAYRNTDVDIGSVTGGGNYVGWTRPNEWLQYTVNVTQAGSYTFDMRVANVGTGAMLVVDVDGTPWTGSMSVPNTGGWQTWTTVSVSGLSLSTGTHVLRVRFTNGTAENGGVGNIDWFRFTAGGSVGSTPFTGTPIPLPGRIQAEAFDNGGPNVAYVDTTSGNTGGAYRVNTDVDLGSATDTGGGYYVGWTRPGEWLNYTVSVATAGTYTLDIRVANKGTGGRFRVEVNGANVTGSVALPDTGDWQGWQTVSVPGIALAAGTYRVRLVFETGTTQNGGVGNVNYLEFR